jgi:hypothetical protein
VVIHIRDAYLSIAQLQTAPPTQHHAGRGTDMADATTRIHGHHSYAKSFHGRSHRIGTGPFGLQQAMQPERLLHVGDEDVQKRNYLRLKSLLLTSRRRTSAPNQSSGMLISVPQICRSPTGASKS